MLVHASLQLMHLFLRRSVSLREAMTVELKNNLLQLEADVPRLSTDPVETNGLLVWWLEDLGVGVTYS